MTKSLEALKVEFQENLGGEYSAFHQSGPHCFAYAVLWIKCRIIGFDHAFILELFKERGSLIAEQAGWEEVAVKEGNNARASYEVKDLKSSWVFGRESGLTSRKKVIRFVMSDPGVWLFGACQGGGRAGHAVAFDTQPGQFSFFDPNTGIYSAQLDSAANRPDARIQSWFHDYWSTVRINDTTYKRRYRGGPRYLVRYRAGSGLTSYNGGDLAQVDITTLASQPAQLNFAFAVRLQWDRYLPMENI